MPFDALNLALPVAFAIMLVASAILLLRTRRLHFLVQAVGFAALVISQALQYGAFQVYPSHFDSGGGLLPNGARDNLIVLALWLSIFGLGVAAIGYAFQCVAAGRDRSGT